MTLTVQEATLRDYLNTRPPIAGSLLETLREQNGPLTPAQEKNLAALSSGAACVVTGQQLGIFFGPLLTLYKTCAALAYARELESRFSSPVVPIFWLQSEDHDLAEVASVSVVDSVSRLQTLSLVQPEEASANRRPVGSLRFDASIAALLDAAKHYVGNAEAAALFEAHYRPGASFAEAFRGILQELFANRGLLTLDPRTPEISKLLQPTYRRVLDERRAISDVLTANARELEAAGESVQVKIRTTSPLFFFHPDGPDGERFRLEQDGERFSLRERQLLISDSELGRLLDTHPEQFSSSALLRPLLQDMLLPTVAYVAGPAEAAYWKQIVGLYELFGRPQPLVLPRSKLLLLEPKVRKLAGTLGLSSSELSLDSAQLRERLLTSGLPESLSPKAVRAHLENQTLSYLDSALNELLSRDPSLASELSRTKEKVDRAVQAFLDKLNDSLERRQQTADGRAENLLAHVAPGGIPQERGLSFLHFWLRYDRRLLDTVFDALRLYDDRVIAADIS